MNQLNFFKCITVKDVKEKHVLAEAQDYVNSTYSYYCELTLYRISFCFFINLYLQI